jgi:hypothetical protein
MSYVLAVKCTELLAAAVPATQWIACSAGHGAKGRRLYDRTRVELAASTTVGMARWLLVRRSRLSGWSGWPELGGRWRRASSRPRARSVGLDHYEVRKWPGWYRHITLALLAHAFLAVTRARAASEQAGSARGARRPDRRARPAAADGP